jgi:hypothetical protein
LAENDPSLPLGATAPVPDVLQDGGLAGPKAATYRNEVWETAAAALYQQELSASYLRVWRWIERGSLFLVTATASGSSIIVWGVWKTPLGQVVWTGLAAVAGVVSAFRISQKASVQIVAEEKLLDAYRKPAMQAQDLLHDLEYGLSDMEAHKRVYALRKLAQACPTRPRGGILDMAWYHNQATLRAAKIMKGWQRDGT